MAGDSTLSIDDGWLDVAGAKLEYRRWRPVGVSSHGSAWVLLHEGLGCVETWRDFPAALARHSRSDVYAYSRAGYGRSSTIALPRRVDFMEREALDVLPEVLRGLGLDSPHLLGHSDGGTIALLAAAQDTVPFATVTALAAHVFNEPMCKAAIENTGNMFAQGPLREALARYHPNQVDVAFWGWHDVWLSDAFTDWNITEHLARIDVPLLAMQGREDRYGSLDQLDTIARQVPNSQRVLLDDCGHSIHRDQPEALLDAVLAMGARTV